LTIENNLIDTFRETSNNQNYGGITSYDSHHITIRNNEIKNCSIGLHFKDNIDDSLVENNYIHGNYIGIYQSNTNPGGACERNTYNNNVIVNNSYVGFESPNNGTETSRDLVVTHNTIYRNTSDGLSLSPITSGYYPIIHSNIFGSSSNPVVMKYTVVPEQMDHNIFYNPLNFVASPFYSPFNFY